MTKTSDYFESTILFLSLVHECTVKIVTLYNIMNLYVDTTLPTMPIQSQ